MGRVAALPANFQRAQDIAEVCAQRKIRPERRESEYFKVLSDI